MARPRQLAFFPAEKSEYGGSLMTKRNCRSRARPLAVRSSMHLVLKSSLARGEWSLRRHRASVTRISEKFCSKYGVSLLSLANVGNHLHYHIQLSRRRDFAPFIRALTGALAMAVTKVSRWYRPKALYHRGFWDHRPFTRIVAGFRDFLNLTKYVTVNHFEGQGLPRSIARDLAQHQFAGPSDPRLDWPYSRKPSRAFHELISKSPLRETPLNQLAVLDSGSRELSASGLLPQRILEA